jgi:Spy/CpxP family protein refolding chaperone
MTKKVMAVAAAVLIVFAVGIFLSAAPGPRDRMKHAGFGLNMAEKSFLHCEMLLKFKDEIGLTPEQVGKIEKMRDSFTEASIKQEADIKIQGLKLISILKKDQVDRKAAEKMIRDISKLKTDLQIDRMNYLMDVKSVLTPEQIKKIEDLRKQRIHDRMNNRRDMMKDRMQNRQHRMEGNQEK